MSDFNSKLRQLLIAYADRSEESFYRIAKNANIPEQVIYSFRSGNAGLNNENTVRLADYLNINLKELLEK